MNTSADGLVLSLVGYRDPRVRALVEQVQAEYVKMYGSPDETPVDAAEFDPPTGVFFIAEIDGLPIGCGGWRSVAHDTVGTHDAAGTAEIKRMYVSPPGRRRGVAQAVLAELERSARAAGRARMVLETGTEQPAAVAMYRAAGYEPIPGYGYYRCSPSSITLGRWL